MTNGYECLDYAMTSAPAKQGRSKGVLLSQVLTGISW